VEGIGHAGASSNPPVTRTMKIFNEIPYAIGIASRDGLKYDLPPSTNLVQNSLIVQIQYELSRGSRDTLEKLLCSSSVDNSIELQLIKQALSQDGFPSRGRQTRFDIEYIITESDLKQHGGVVYISDLDLVISTKGCDAIKYHPYGKEASLYAFAEESFNEVDNITGQNFIYSIKLIDNFGNIGKRWLRIGDDVVLIKPVKDQTRTDGIYVATKKPSVNNLGEAVNLTERYDIDQVPPYFKLYKQFHDARHTAEDEMTMKLSEFEMKRKKMETDLAVSENALLRVTQEADNLRMTAESMQTKHANEMHSMRMQLEREVQERITMQRKDQYEAVSVDRKNTAELVKVVPAIVLGLIGIIAAVQKVLK
jgi:hypothetical protein